MTPLPAKTPAVACVFLSLALSLGAVRAQKPESEQSPIAFEDAAAHAGIDYRNLYGTADKPYIIETIGNGVAWIDYDNDGWLDLFVVNGSTLENQEKGEKGPGNRLYHNQQDGTFADVTAGSGLAGGYWGVGAAAGDYDNDGWVDLYVTAVLEPNHLYRNNGDGTFTDLTEKAGVGGRPSVSASAVFFDYDRDSHLDLFVTNYVTFDRAYLDSVSPHCLWKGLRVMCGPIGVPGAANVLYHNNGDGTFTDVTEKAGLVNPELKSLGAIPADFDEDGWPDLYVASDSTVNALYRNRGDGTFEDVTLLSGAGYSQDGRAQAGMGVDAGDFTEDGRLDLFISNFQDDYNTLYRNEGDFLFADATFAAKLGHTSFDRLGWGAAIRDFDNDGHLDLFVANGHVYPQVDAADIPETYPQANQLFRNLGRGQFVEVSGTAGEALQTVHGSRGAAFGDYDNDGRIDIAVVNMDDGLTLLRNVTRTRNHWLAVRLVGAKSNRDGMGARLRLKAGERVYVQEAKTGGSYASSNDPRIHFGLGSADTVEWLEIEWLSGTKQKLTEVPLDRVLVVDEETGLKTDE